VSAQQSCGKCCSKMRRYIRAYFVGGKLIA